MRRFIITTCLVGSSLLILDSFNAGHVLVMFFFAGIIPGTNIVISADLMLEFFALLMGVTLSRVTLAVIRAYPSKGTILSAQS